MDLRALHYFAVVAEELNITRAAERLNMSQPPLSAQIKGLEEELGVQLFIRGKRHLTITDAGTHLYRRARQILELSEQTQQELMSMEGLSGDLNISLVEGRAPFLLARWIAGFRSEFPRVAIHLWNGSGDEVMERVQRGLADLALHHLLPCPKSLEATVGTYSQLSPLYTQEMMGFPSGWTEHPFLSASGEGNPSEPTGTPSCPK